LCGVQRDPVVYKIMHGMNNNNNNNNNSNNNNINTSFHVSIL